ncbi:P-loop NTPase fold protein [Hoeflea sp.]|uniref:P-loop NTPase fold protein n=1 Tax=Hoeflea sp. TaxID=1940281 RepID=UPI003747ACD6
MDALDIRDEKSLRSWLEGKPAEWAQLIALRAALRVFPLVLEGLGESAAPERARFQELTIAVWRCLLISSVAPKYPTDEMRASASASASAYAASARAAAAADDAAYAAYAAAASGDAAYAAYAAAASAASASPSAADVAADAAYAAARVAAARAVSAADSAAWETVRSDCQILARDGPEPLESAPMWLEQQPQPNGEAKQVIAIPRWVADAAASLAKNLASLLGPDAELIADWYRPLLAGDATADWSQMFLGERARKLALREDAFWEVTENREAETLIEGIAAALGWKPAEDPNQPGSFASDDQGEVLQGMSKAVDILGDTSILEEGARKLAEKAEEIRGKEPEPEPDPAPVPDPARAETAYIGDTVDGSVDYLKRSEIAFALAAQLNDVWDSMNPEPRRVVPFYSAWRTGWFKRGPKETLEPGFVVHIDAPWGGGKTTFAQYLTQILNPYRLRELPDWLKVLPLGDAEKWKKSHRRPWHVVQFNAWQHEHVSPPWWVFYETIREAATEAAVNETNQRWFDLPPAENEDLKNHPAEPLKAFGYDYWLPMAPLRRFRFRVSEFCWRLFSPNNVTSIVIFVCVLAVVTLLFATGFVSVAGDKISIAQTGAAKTGGEAATTQMIDWGAYLRLGLTAVLGGGAAIWALVSAVAKSLLPGTPDAAKNYSMGAGDPLQRMRKHFLRLTKRLNRPIIVIVDDLDRCKAKFVTELFRGMQTVLASPRVVYVLLGDRDWIEQAFAEVNKEMMAIDVGAEHSFGGRFVEKAIQLSMVLPAMTGDVREGYVEFLLTGKHRMADPVAAPKTFSSTAPDFDLESLLKNARVKTAPADQGAVDEIDKQVRDALSKTSFKARESAAQQVFASLKTSDSLKLGDIGDQIRRSFGRELDFLAVGDEEAEAETRHLLLALAPALPPNPRQIKRILNTLTLNQQVMTKIYPEYRAGSTEWQQLARWVVMAVEWPMSWFTLTRHPQLADVVLAMSVENQDEEKIEQALAKVDGELSPDQAKALAEKLADTKPVTKLLTFSDSDNGWPDAPLTTEVIGWLADIMPATSGRLLEATQKPAPKEPAKEGAAKQADA